MAKKAIAYVSDIVLGSTGEVISRATQMAAIKRHAEESGYEIVAWYEDDVYAEDVITRPGVQRLLAHEGEYDTVLVERVWTFSRHWVAVEPFFKEMQRRGHKVESTITLWDCLSQRSRHYFRDGKRAPAAVMAPVVVTADARAKVAAPAHLNFVPLRRRLAAV
jgi:hypothetical protein